MFTKLPKYVLPVLILTLALLAATVPAFADGPVGSVTVEKMSVLPQPAEGATPVLENAGHISGGRPDKSPTRFPPYLPMAVIVEKAREGVKLHAQFERSAWVEQLLIVQPDLGGYVLSFSNPRELTEEMYFAVRIPQDNMLFMNSTGTTASGAAVSAFIMQEIPGLKYGEPTYVGFLVREDLGRRVRIWSRMVWPVEIQLAGQSGRIMYDPVEHGITGDRNIWFAVKAAMGTYRLNCSEQCQLHVAPLDGEIGADYLIQGEVVLLPNLKYRVENTGATPGNQSWALTPVH